jgi:serine/threonine protein kinase
MPLRIGETFAGYRVLRLLGSGGMGEVYLVQHPRLPRQEALKVLRPDISSDPSFRERFIREADLAASLRHPHVVGVHDRGEYDGQLWITMDYINGMDLALQMAQRYPAGMPVELVVPIATAVASALDNAHKKSLLHRDVKPANIIVADFGTDDMSVFLADFGIARHTDDISGLTSTNIAVGTVSYAAPEQLMGDPMDGRADQYALAATTYHLLGGRAPFVHTNPAVVISKHLTAPPPLLSHIRPELAALDDSLATGLAKNPSSRYRTCAEFAAALHDASHPVTARSVRFTLPATPLQHLDATVGAQAFAALPTLAAPLTPTRGTGRPRPWWRRRKVVLPIAAIAASACIATAVIALNQDPGIQPSAAGHLPPGQLRIGQISAVSAPDPTLATSPVVTAARPSIVDIRATAPGCASAANEIIRSNGFVVGPNRIMTTAHTLAGSTSVTAVWEGRAYDATVVSHNAGADVAIIAVDGLTAPPLSLYTSNAVGGAGAIVVAYSESNVYTAAPARIAEMIQLNHRDIYDRQTVAQEVYTVKGPIHQSDAGAPLLDVEGRVLGMVFAVAVDNEDVGFAFSAAEIAHQMSQLGRSKPTSTGACAR